MLAGVSYDAKDVLKRAAAKHKITFPLLSDSASATIDVYGVRNKEATGKYAGIPYPTTFVIDGKGVIRAKLFHEGYQERHTADDLINEVKRIR